MMSDATIDLPNDAGMTSYLTGNVWIHSHNYYNKQKSFLVVLEVLITYL